MSSTIDLFLITIGENHYLCSDGKYIIIEYNLYRKLREKGVSTIYSSDIFPLFPLIKNERKRN